MQNTDYQATAASFLCNLEFFHNASSQTEALQYFSDCLVNAQEFLSSDGTNFLTYDYCNAPPEDYFFTQAGNGNLLVPNCFETALNLL